MQSAPVPEDRTWIVQNEHVYENRPIRGDYFMDRLGGWTEVLLASVGLGIVLFNPRQPGGPGGHAALGALYCAEIVAAILITQSRLPLMRLALWILVGRVCAGIGYMGLVHHDRLAQSTLGFPVVVAIYCFARVRALTICP